jgi:glycosyltransferase involved in cell wall biosynthesis
MKLLWVKTDFLHPTTRGGQIRTLEMLRQLHRHHEVHYVAFEDGRNPEGLRRSSEYSSFAYPVPHRPIPKTSVRFAGQLASGLVSSLPVAGMRWRSQAMRSTIDDLLSQHRFDAKVCDFLFPSINIGDLRDWVLFQHNVETVIWERHAESGRTPVHRAYFQLQAKRMLAWERSVCNAAARVVAVSEADEQTMRSRFGIRKISSVPTGVDLSYFQRPSDASMQHDLVFVGSMDWMPNIDGTRWFLKEVFPFIRAKRSNCSLAIVGRNPPPALLAEASDPLITVTGTVPDVRPYLWNSTLAIVPLRIGGGTRLKIFESMAAGTPVVSTTIGAEGLPLRDGETIRLADSASDFAAECLALLEDGAAREKMAAEGLALIRAKYSWEQATQSFEDALLDARETVSRTA